MSAKIQDELESDIIGIIQSEMCDWGSESAEAANGLARSMISQIIAAKRAYLNGISSDTFRDVFDHKCRYKVKFQYHASAKQLLYLSEHEQDLLLQKLNISVGKFSLPL